MRRLFSAVCALCLAVLNFIVIPVQAEPGFDDTDYWNGKCGTSSVDYDEAGCAAFTEYLNGRKQEYQQAQQELETLKAEIGEKLEEYGRQMDELNARITELEEEIYQKEDVINGLQVQIDTKQAEIDAKQLEIDSKQEEIDDTQADVDAAKDKVKSRMVNSQSTMRLNKYTDILLGATTFEEFLRIANGLSAINDYDQKVMEELKILIVKLNEQKAEMEVAKAEMEAAKQELEGIQAQVYNEMVSLQNDRDVLRIEEQKIEAIAQEAKRQQAELRAKQSQYSAAASEISSMMTQIAASGRLEEVPGMSSSGWVYPVPGSYKSGGTWYYFGGIEHLGVDLATSAGSPILAVGNGIVLLSANGCDTYGWYGNYCAGYGGVGGGGNQIYLLTVIDGSLYGVQYFHMMLNSPIAAGTIVTAGQQIGRVGSSGNSTGPHCHVEIIYLGDGSNFSYYAQHWNGDLTFGAGWGSPYGDGRKCDHGYDAPCRVRPETVLGI